MAKTIEDTVSEAIMKQMLAGIDVATLVKSHTPTIEKMVKRCVESALESFEENYIERFSEAYYDGYFEKVQDALDKFVSEAITAKLGTAKAKKSKK